ncbi:MAG: SGNH/GDSL hydrolase family protein [Thermoanaerobaculia bacterium]|nr:SGNH/GDSL hydrolase family protein [Thermoanaerobaculia bacterium]
MNRRVRGVFELVGLILFGTLIALLALEIGLRVAGVGGPAELDADYDRPVVLYSPHPDRQPRPAEEGEEVLRVAVVGDSFTVGFATEWYDAYPQRLEHLLNLNPGAAPARVRTFAQNDTTTFDQLRFLDEVMAWGPDILILGVFLNDTEDRRDPELARYQEALSTRVPSGWRLRALRASRLAAWVYLRLESMRSYRAALALQEHVFEREYSGFRRFRRAVRSFAAACRENDAALVAVIWPSMGGLGPGYPHRLAHDRLAEALGEARIPTLDLLDAFRDKSSRRLAIYPEVDNHPNEIGYRIGAAAIFNFLLSSGLVGPEYRPERGHRLGPAYWLGRVRRRHSPLHLGEPPRRQPPAAERSAPSDDDGP